MLAGTRVAADYGSDVGVEVGWPVNDCYCCWAGDGFANDCYYCWSADGSASDCCCWSGDGSEDDW